MLTRFKRWQTNQPIKRKLIWVVMFVVTTTIISTFSFMFWIKTVQQRQDFVQTNMAWAKLVADFTVLPLVFEDVAAIEGHFGQLSKDSRLAYLKLTSPKKVFFKYDPQNIEAGLPDLTENQQWLLGDDYFHFQIAIHQDNQLVGTLRAALHLDELKQQQLRELQFMLLILLLAMLGSYGMARGLRRFIMSPISRLEQHTRRNAAKTHSTDLLLDAPKTNDEISRLYDSFNLLMRRIEQRESEILQFNSELESKVAQRTKELHAKSNELDNYFNSSLDLFCITDFHGYFLKVNPRWHDTLGYSDHELQRQPFFAFVHPDDQQRTQQAMAELRERFYLSNFVNRYRHHNGSYLWIEWSCIVKDQLIYAAARDISERKHAEEGLRLSNLVFQNSSEGMVVVNADNAILSVNPAFSMITGYSQDEVIGRDPKLLGSGSQETEFYRNMWQELNSTGHWQGEINNRHKNGQIYVEHLTINNVYDDLGKVIRRVGLFSDITEKKKSEKQIWYQANYDSLTELPNRRLFADRLQQEIRKAKREKYLMALLFLDLDRFKEVNDSYGHKIGDALLIEAAHRISQCVRESDTVSRLGGDEFTVILSEIIDISDVDRVAKAIIDALCQPYFFNTDHIFISASIGIALYPSDTTQEDDLVRFADQAMYAAKNKGRNGFCFFMPSMQEASQNRMLMLTHLHLAIQRQEFVVFYQPIIDLQSGAIYKAEALIRWLHPSQGLVSPADFIPIAEEHGLIHEIGQWVFHQVVDQFKDWQAQYQTHLQISVNVSPLQFQGLDNFVEEWLLYLQTAGIAPDNIIIEITEGVLLEANTKAMEKLFAFADNDMQIAIDDFGTGYSSLSYLTKFDIHFLKIDKSFVNNLTPESNDLTLIKAIIILAHQLGLKVIAEGVETELQRDLLQQMGCDFAQGYLYSKPLSAAEFTHFL